MDRSFKFSKSAGLYLHYLKKYKPYWSKYCYRHFFSKETPLIQVLSHGPPIAHHSSWKEPTPQALQCCAYSPFTNLKLCLKTQKIITFPLTYIIFTAEAIIRISIFIICCVCGFKKEPYMYFRYYHGLHITLYFLPWSGHYHFLQSEPLGFSLSVFLTVQFFLLRPREIMFDSH